jgi:TetR/AcrR family transcriptional regulator
MDGGRARFRVARTQIYAAATSDSPAVVSDPFKKLHPGSPESIYNLTNQLIKMKPTPQTRPGKDQAKDKILQAAIVHFGRKGLAGARTDEIAQAAGVNKALLYYYYKSKSNLYAAALHEVGNKVMGSALQALEAGRTPGESILRLALNHFDRILTQSEFQNLFQQEMIRVRRGDTSSPPVLIGSVFSPLLDKAEQVIRRGIRSGEICNVDWLQIIYSGLGANVFYFLSAPVMRLALPFEPLSQENLKKRRQAAIEFLGSALFHDRRQGSRTAQRVLRDTPWPKPYGPRIRRRLT